jgi:hypothetical protein
MNAMPAFGTSRVETPLVRLPLDPVSDSTPTPLTHGRPVSRPSQGHRERLRAPWAALSGLALEQRLDAQG